MRRVTMPVEGVTLECTAPDCNLGQSGARYTTPMLTEVNAMKMLESHLQLNHGQGQVDNQRRQEAGEGCFTKPEKTRRPSLQKGISEDRYLTFERQWARYKKSTGMQDESMIRAQLLACCSEELGDELDNFHGAQLDQKNEEELMAEMRKLAVVTQNNLVNIMKLRSIVQDRDEPVKSFMARLKGIAEVCKLTVKCPCNPGVQVSYADKEIYHCLVKGLADMDIRNQVMGEVQEMDLDALVKYVEAKESGRKAGRYLDSGEAEVNKITGYRVSQREQQLAGRETVDNEVKCKFCGRKGHGGSPNFEVKKEKCIAFDKKCITCGKIGHFSKTRACRQDVARVEEIVVQHEKKTGKDCQSKSKGLDLCELAVQEDAKKEELKWPVNKAIPHMMDVGGTLVEAMPRAHPTLRVQLRVDVETYRKLGIPLILGKSHMSKKGRLFQTPRLELLCDTGAQVDCISRRKLKMLGLREDQLRMPQVSLDCANKTEAEVLGVFFGEVSAMEGDWKVDKVKVLFYVLKQGGDMLSRHTCERLGLINEDFPKPGSVVDGADKGHAEVHEMDGGVYQEEGECDPDSELPCRCPRREFVDPPTCLPFEPTEENRAKIEGWIKEYFKGSAFNICKRQTMPCTEGPPMKIHTHPDAIPVAIHKPVPVPLHYREEVRAQLRADVKRGVLRKVGPGEPVKWCARMIIQPKKDGRPRRTVDLSGLTKAGVRETHHTRSPFRVVCSVPRYMLKSTLDCVDGYHGVPLAEEDKHKTVFITEDGRYEYQRIPQGYGASNDGYTIRTDEILAKVPGRPDKPDYEKIIDDVIQWSGDMETAFHRVCATLAHCSKAGMVFSPTKFVFAAREVEYAGFWVGWDSIQPTPKYIKNILDFPTPKNISDVRSFFGLVNQVAYAFSKGVVMAPFRELLKPSNKFSWTEELDQSFIAAKQEIVRLVQDGVKMFDPELVTCLSTDFCKTGLGWILQQKTCKCQVISPLCCHSGWRLVLAGGRFTIPAETRYSPTEGEALAVAVGLESSRYYTLGSKSLYVATDHKPLLSILNDRALDTVVNPRLVRIKERTLPWLFDIIYVPGWRQAAADAMSRKKNMAGLSSLSSLSALSEGDNMGIEDAMCVTVSAGLQELSVNSMEGSIGMITWHRLQDATKEDKVLARLMEDIQRGIPDSSNDMIPQVREYHKYRHGLVTVDGVVCYKDRVVIPESLRTQVLGTLHSAHQGVSGMVNRAEQTVFWPGITTDINRTRAMCRTCVRNAPSQPAGTPVAPPSPSYPFEMVVADYCHLNGMNFLVMADRYSGWLSAWYVGKGDFDTDRLIEILRGYFSTFSVPAEISSDMGPQFKSSKFAQFLQRYGVHHRQSSSYFAHSNTRAEVAVKTGKRMIRDNIGQDGKITDKFVRAILQYRNTPLPDTRLSPAQIVFGRQMRDLLPTLNYKYEPSQEWGLVREHRERAMARRLDRDGARLEQYTKKQKVIPIGDTVAVQNQTGRFPKKWDKTGTIVENQKYDKVLVKLDGSGRLTTRNRRFVKRIVSPPDPAQTGVPQAQPVVPISDNDDVIHDGVGDIIPGPGPIVESGIMENNVSDDQITDDNRGDEVEGVIENEVVDNIIGNDDPVPNSRPRRDRKQNVRYSPQEYDLSTVSMNPGTVKLQLSGIYVRPRLEELKKK